MPPFNESYNRVQEPLFEPRPIISHIGRTSLMPVTARSAHALSRIYGYDSPKQMAEDLPDDADVIDVGAGASTLGVEISELRPDINWVNVDICYDDEEIVSDISASQEFPPNFSLLPADIMTLPETLGEKSFDRVFSYFMLQHIEIADKEAALIAAKNMLKIIKPGGQLSIGPTRGLSLPYAVILKPRDSVTVESPKEVEELNELAETLIEKIRLRAFAAYRQKRNNRVVIK
ncbi:MAG TPA: class I SAM-dependent methyltransferase [Candidatus Saccharimonadales bacterium]|nr:class I SAM-dependent methyltransferase [Candidatus Saccharimonadales bacterium]